MKFSEFVKNKYTVDTIKDMVRSKRVTGTVLFEGGRGSGKSQLAKTLAKAIVCQNEEYKEKCGEACGECSSCKKADMNIHPDIITAEPEENKAGSFHIDKIREITDDLYLSPNDSDMKVYILEDLQNMTVQAQNALLKSIEEPPPFAVFIITVTSHDLILDTVTSRAVKFSMEYIDNETMREYVKQRFGIKSDSEKTDRAVKFSNGSIGMAIDIFMEETDVYSDMKKRINQVLRIGARDSKIGVLEAVQQMTAKNYTRTELLNFYFALEMAARDVLIAKVFMDDENEQNNILNLTAYFDDWEEIEGLANLYSSEKIFQLLQNIHDFKSNLDYNINTRINISGFFASCLYPAFQGAFNKN